MRSFEIPLRSQDGHRHQLRACVPAEPTAALLWLPALGVAARHYQPFAESLAARGVAVFVHEWRGHGSSSLRASRDHDWGYRELLEQDLPASESGVQQALADSDSTGLPCIIGGHSLGGQLASCRLGMAPDFASRLWLVASGAPYWRAFPPPTRYWLCHRSHCHQSPKSYPLPRRQQATNGCLLGLADQVDHTCSRFRPRRRFQPN